MVFCVKPMGSNNYAKKSAIVDNITTFDQIYIDLPYACDVYTKRSNTKVN